MTIITPPPKEPSWLQPFLSFCHRRRYPKNTEIMRQGDPADVLYYLVDGSVSALMEDDDGREIILAYLNKGDFIGEMSLFLPQPTRSVMVRARTDCQIAEITYKRLEQLFDSDLRNHAKEILFAIGELDRLVLDRTEQVADFVVLAEPSRLGPALAVIAGGHLHAPPLTWARSNLVEQQ